jgi:LPS-assembly lipoprotein
MRAAALLALLGLAGCGFEPLYGRGGGGGDPGSDLAGVYVNNIVGRYGQQVRENLQQRLDLPVSGAAAIYTLDVSPGQSSEGLAIQPDNSSTYTRIVGTANWTLRTVGVPPRVLATGSARTVDGYNNIDEQYFQSTISNETAQGRIAANLADAIALQVAAWFRREHERGDPDLRAAAHG